MQLAELRRIRLHVQGLRGVRAASAAGVVRDFAAVQSQEFVPAQWGLAMRVPAERRPDLAAVTAALDRGEILRTHVLRPTWHFVDPADARWLMELSAERVHRANATYYRRTGVDGEAGARALDVVTAALEGGHRTRAELAAALDAAGHPSTGLGFTYVLMLAELERVAISGANVGRQRTYAAFDERVPPSAPKLRAASLVELAARFIRSRGPVSDRDFAAWSGFTLGDTRLAFSAVVDEGGGRVETVEVDGAAHWHDVERTSAALDAPVPPSGTVDLLQAYDEYIMGYAAPRSFLQPPGRGNPVHPEFPLHALMIDGVMVGRWAPVISGRKAVVRLVPWRAFTAREERGLAASVAEVERFLGAPVTVEREPVAD
ncbi:winged helix DNA-binding domain-containing protein [Agromyces cerinus]|uniref:Winged helix DNA-binding domain-containing protein n=1 Tax=Agromyces cerinus subsp. cerinus TaxID=232089 RepID=A0A1N6GD64_9MICO|nr:winged helix DNA-binding domain-containing protein [Agromyces cerinus]SIO05426.1 Winged helix DNA-binding domain-containing protein [Agromyces cerinus subsp. cerinus]